MHELFSHWKFLWCVFSSSPLSSVLRWNAKGNVLQECISLFDRKVMEIAFFFPAKNVLILLLLCSFRRLAKSTLLLIPLFGINFIVFAFIPEQMKTELRLVFDLILGSFQVWNQLFLSKTAPTPVFFFIFNYFKKFKMYFNLPLKCDECMVALKFKSKNQ